MAKEIEIKVAVTSRNEGFRRAGQVWTAERKETTVTPEQLATLQSDRMLIVEVLPPEKGAKNEAT